MGVPQILKTCAVAQACLLFLGSGKRNLEHLEHGLPDLHFSLQHIQLQRAT
jgi:hypothetical protein